MHRSLFVVVTAALLAGCGGGGARSLPPVVPAGSPLPGGSHASAGAHVTITIPGPPSATSSNLRRARYVSSATNSLSIVVDNTTSVVNLSAKSPACVPGAGGSRTCTVDLGLPAGNNVVFTVKLFAASDGTGIPLSIATLTKTIVANSVNPIALTLNGVVGSLTATIVPATFAQGQTNAPPATVTVNALDPAAQTIVVPPGVLVDSQGNPVTITLADSDTSGATKLSSTTVGNQPITLTYNGGIPSTSVVTITATATSTAGSAVTGTGTLLVQPPQSLYVLNGDGSVSEFAIPLPAGTATPAPRRAFGVGGQIAGCGSSIPAPGKPVGLLTFAVDAIAIDPAGTAYLVSDAGNAGRQSCPIVSNIFEFSANAGPTSNPSVMFQENANVDNPRSPTVAFDAKSAQPIDVSDASTLTNPVANSYTPTLGLINKFSITGNAETFVYSAQQCFVQSATFQCPPVGQSQAPPAPAPFLISASQQVQKDAQPFAIDANDDLVVTAEDRRGPIASGGTLGGSFYAGPPAIVLIPQASVSTLSGGPLVTTQTWIEGPNTELSAPLSLAVDEHNILYVLDGDFNNADYPAYPGNPSFCSAAPQPDTTPFPPNALCPSDGNAHFYLLAFDLNALQSAGGPCAGVPGPCDLHPLFILGGGATARFQWLATPGFNAISSPLNANFFPGGNLLTVQNGLAYVANATGPTPDAASGGTQFVGGGEVDVYRVAGVTGVHFDDAVSAPLSVLPMTKYLNVPAGVAIGSAGSATAGINGVRRVPLMQRRRPAFRQRFGR